MNYSKIYLRSGGIRNVNPVLSKAFKVPSFCGHIDVYPETIAVVGKFVDNESVLIENVDLPRDVVVCLGEIPHKGDLDFPSSCGGAETEGQHCDCLEVMVVRAGQRMMRLTARCLNMVAGGQSVCCVLSLLSGLGAQ